MDKEFDQLRKVLAHNVRTLRRAQKLSQEELGFEAEIDRTYVSQIERSIINPSLLILHRVARALKTNAPALLLSKRSTNPRESTISFGH